MRRTAQHTLPARLGLSPPSQSSNSKQKLCYHRGLIGEIEIWRAAVLMVDRYADEAKLNSLRRAAELIVEDDQAGGAIWRRIAIVAASPGRTAAATAAAGASAGLSAGRNGIGTPAQIAAGNLASQRSALRRSMRDALLFSASACARIAAAWASPCSAIALASACACSSRASAAPFGTPRRTVRSGRGRGREHFRYRVEGLLAVSCCSPRMVA